MSRRLGGVDGAVATDVIASVVELPSTIELVSLRMLGWSMGDLVHGGAHLNLLSLEALAAACHLGAEICLAETDNNEPLMNAAHRWDVTVRRVTC